MIIPWMVASILAGCALTVAAMAVDQIVFLSRRQRRFIWLASVTLTAIWPGLALLRDAVFGSTASLSSAGAPLVGIQRLGTIVVPMSTWSISPSMSLVISILWVLISVGLIARIVFAVRRVRRYRNECTTTQIDGVNVSISPHIGPAVIGLRPMRVAIPEWVVDLDQASRALILRHEEEHRAAGDPYLLFAGTLLTALLPWNLPLWFQVSRMRLAIELDCDTRVLRNQPSWQSYAHLLVSIAQRRAQTTGMLAPALSESPSNLERRITAMRSMPLFSTYRVIALTLGACAAFALACAVDKPESPDARKSAAAVSQSRAAAPQKSSGGKYFEFQVEKAATLLEMSKVAYPPNMPGSRARVDVYTEFVVDETGRVDMQTFKVLKPADPDPAVIDVIKNALRTARYEPARVGDRKVKQLVQQPFEFGDLSRLPAGPTFERVPARAP